MFSIICILTWFTPYTWVMSHETIHWKTVHVFFPRNVYTWITFLIIYFSDEAFDTYKFFQIGLASILLVTLPIMIGCLKFNLWISRENKKCSNKQPKKVSALIYARRKLNPKNQNLASEWNGCQNLLLILHLHLLKPMPRDEIRCNKILKIFHFTEKYLIH